VDASLIVADANKQRSIPGSEWNKAPDSQGVSRATKEYLATLDDAAFGAANEVVPKFISPSDPAAQWTGVSLPRKGCRVGLRIVLFEACSAFTRVTACTLALSPIRDKASAISSPP
jgi:hypothetical protein